jgi:hypothetical protein
MTCATAADGLRARRRLPLGEVHRQRRKRETVVGHKIHSPVYSEYHRAAPGFGLLGAPDCRFGRAYTKDVVPPAVASQPEQLKV